MCYLETVTHYCVLEAYPPAKGRFSLFTLLHPCLLYLRVALATSGKSVSDKSVSLAQRNKPLGCFPRMGNLLLSYAHVVHAFANSRLVSRVRLNIPQQEPLCDLEGVSVTLGFFDKRLGLWLSLPHVSILSLTCLELPNLVATRVSRVA